VSRCHSSAAAVVSTSLTLEIFDEILVPQLVTYKGRPIKRRTSVVRDGQRGLALIFYAPKVGQQGDSLFVTDAEWQQDGKVEQCAQKPDVRALAAVRNK
jgi:hypothetical protein